MVLGGERGSGSQKKKCLMNIPNRKIIGLASFAAPQSYDK